MFPPATHKLSILDQYGRPVRDEPQPGDAADARREVRALRAEILRDIRAKYDATHTTPANEAHWQWADHLDPHAAAAYQVRRRLRARSRYELQENNAYLKGAVLTIANDFVGSGPKLRIIDKRIPRLLRLRIEQRGNQWFRHVGFRAKLWRMRLAKLVDGESFLVSFRDAGGGGAHPVQLNFTVIETDRCTDGGGARRQIPAGLVELDGVRFDPATDRIGAYYFLDHHPGWTGAFSTGSLSESGSWYDAAQVIHWFRRDRGWLRGIPEAAASLPLCAILRRYTLAVLRAAELAASFAVLLKSQYPPGTSQFGRTDDPFDNFPIEPGLMTTLPWGMEPFQLDSSRNLPLYDSFVEALLREIMRPLLIPFNLVVGTSKDSNMASAIVDAHLYKAGHRIERYTCEEMVLDPALTLWWREARLVPEYFRPDPHVVEEDRSAGGADVDPAVLLRVGDFATELPEHEWRWDEVGVEHTDPVKVVRALQIARDAGFLTDRQIQETRYNRDREEWREEVRQDQDFRREVGLLAESAAATSARRSPAPASNGESSNGRPQAAERPGFGR